MINFNFDELATDKAAKKVAQLFQRAGAPVIQTEADSRIKRTAGVTYREMHFTHADGQRTSIRITKSGDVGQVLINGSVIPLKNQDNPTKAIGEITKRLEDGRAKFQAKLARTKVELPKGIKTAAPKLEQKLTEEVQRLDSLIAQRSTELADLKAKLGPVMDGVSGSVALCAAISEALEVAGILSTATLDSVDYGAAKAILCNALEVVENNWPINMANGNVAQADAEQDAAKSIRDALVVLDGARGRKEDPLTVVVRDEIGIVMRMSPSDFMAAMKREGMPSRTFLEEAIKVYNEHKKKIGSTMRAETALTGGKKVLDGARKLNQKDYAFYVVAKGKIESGWEYREDANDQAKDNLPPSMGAKVYSKAALKKLKLNPDDNSHWLTQADLMDEAEVSDGKDYENEEDDDFFDEESSSSLFDDAYIDGPLEAGSNKNVQAYTRDGEVLEAEEKDIFYIKPLPDTATTLDGVMDSLSDNPVSEKLEEISGQEWGEIPSAQVINALASGGYIPYEDNGMIWTGRTESESGREVYDLKQDDLLTAEQFTFQWEKLPSGQYQVAAFLS